MPDSNYFTAMFCNSNIGFYQTFQASNVLLDLTAASSEQSRTGRYSCNGANFQQDLGSPVEQIENVRKIFPLLKNLLHSIVQANMHTVCYIIYIPLSEIWNHWILWTVDRSCIRFYLLFIRK